MSPASASATTAPRPTVQLWTGPLARLLPVLTERVAEVPPETWIARLLPRGALVALLRDSQGRRVLRIARKERPETTKAREAWAHEVLGFCRTFGITQWESIPADSPGIAAAFREPLMLPLL